MPDRKMLIINPHAGSADHLAGLLSHLPDVDVRPTTSMQDARRAVRDARQQGIDTLIAGGGDGTVRTIVDAIASESADLRLGILPLGTANSLCRSLHIPADPHLAAIELARGTTRRMDIVQMTTPTATLYYANLAHGGNTQRVIDSLTDEMKQRWGPWCYVRGAIGVLTDLQGFPMEIQIDDQPVEPFSVWTILLANGRWAASTVEAAPDADLEDGLLELIIIQDGTPLDQARLTGEFLLGTYLDDPNVVHRRVRQVRVVCRDDGRFTADGEVVCAPWITFRVLPQRLRVIVGRGYASGGQMR